MSSITVVFPVKNEVTNLNRSLPLVIEIGPIIIVDSGSGDDGTKKLALEFGAEWIHFQWNGKFPKKRNWLLKNYNFTTDWVLFLDADEFVTKEFIKEIKNIIHDTKEVGFWLNYKNYFMGSELLYGDLFKKLALFRVGAGEYEKIDEDHWSHLDMEVHEHPVLKGTVGDISTPIEHHDLRGLRSYIAKHNEYSSWEAVRCQHLLNGEKAAFSKLTNRQKKKYRNLSKWWLAPSYFFYCYFLKKGFLDGSKGFHFALMKAIYFYNTRIKILEIQRVSSVDS